MNIRSTTGVLASVIALAAVNTDAWSKTKTGVAVPEFTAGDYVLHVEATKGVKKRRSVDGTLTLRALTAKFDDGLGHPYHGWTDVDFRGLGAAIDATAVPATSRDPENPGVLAVTIPAGTEGLAKYLRVAASGGTVMLLVGTVSNQKETRMYRDGGGIALLAQAWQDGCIVGEWVSHGVAHGAEGGFRLCPSKVRK